MTKSGEQQSSGSKQEGFTEEKILDFRNKQEFVWHTREKSAYTQVEDCVKKH